MPDVSSSEVEGSSTKPDLPSSEHQVLSSKVKASSSKVGSPSSALDVPGSKLEVSSVKLGACCFDGEGWSFAGRRALEEDCYFELEVERGKTVQLITRNLDD